MQIGKLFISPKTITVIVDAVASIAILLIGRYVSPSDVELYVKLVVILQGLAAALFVGQQRLEEMETANMHEAYLVSDYCCKYEEEEPVAETK